MTASAARLRRQLRRAAAGRLCEQTGKTPYATEPTAEATQLGQRAYRCQYGEHWHLTRRKRWRR